MPVGEQPEERHVAPVLLGQRLVELLAREVAGVEQVQAERLAAFVRIRVAALERVCELAAADQHDAIGIRQLIAQIRVGLGRRFVVGRHDDFAVLDPQR